MQLINVPACQQIHKRDSSCIRSQPLTHLLKYNCAVYEGFIFYSYCIIIILLIHNSYKYIICKNMYLFIIHIYSFDIMLYKTFLSLRFVLRTF